MPKQSPNPVNTANAPAVRVYTVVCSMLCYQWQPSPDYKRKGEQLRSDEIIPPQGVDAKEIENNYASSGAVVLVK